MDQARDMHLAVCRRFGAAVVAADGKWGRRSPCDAWDARAVLEHVIGFHDVLVLRPMGLKPTRPRDDPQLRWTLTYDSLSAALRSEAMSLNSELLQTLPRLTRDVLIHTWDLARAVDADDRLDPVWCERFYTDLLADWQTLCRSGMFAAPVEVSMPVDPQTRLLARLGRDPSWR